MSVYAPQAVLHENVVLMLNILIPEVDSSKKISVGEDLNGAIRKHGRW